MNYQYNIESLNYVNVFLKQFEITQLTCFANNHSSHAKLIVSSKTKPQHSVQTSRHPANLFTSTVAKIFVCKHAGKCKNNCIIYQFHTFIPSLMNRPAIKLSTDLLQVSIISVSVFQQCFITS